MAFIATEHDDCADDRMDGLKPLPLEEVMRALGKKDAIWNQPYTRFQEEEQVQKDGTKTVVVVVAEWESRKKGSVHSAMPNSKGKEIQGPAGQWFQPSDLLSGWQAHLTYAVGMHSARRGDDLRRMDYAEFFECFPPLHLHPQGERFKCLAFPVWLNKTNDGREAEDYVSLTNTEDPLEDPLVILAVNLMLETECLGTGKIGTLGAPGYQTPVIRGAPDKVHGGYQRIGYQDNHCELFNACKNPQPSPDPKPCDPTKFEGWTNWGGPK